MSLTSSRFRDTVLLGVSSYSMSLGGSAESLNIVI